MKRTFIVTALTLTAVLTGCGKSGADTATESTPAVTVASEAVTVAAEETTTAAETVTTTAEAATSAAEETSAAETQTTTEAASTDAADNSTGEESTTARSSGVDRETAVSNVKALAGSGAKIVSVTEGTSPEGFKCWIVVVEPITNGTGPDTVTYYSGYQFCYPETTAQPDGQQNPMMNYIGSYSNGRAIMKVSCSGADQASIRISWSGSASDSAIWTMSGDVTTTDEAVTVTYSDCTKEAFSYAADGTVISDTIEYTDGSGRIEFLASDNNAYWYDAQENASGGIPFSYYNE